MDDLNWKEFQRLVPAKIKSVIVTVGTLEAHGCVNNGADNTVPVAIANAVASDVDALIAPHIPYGVTGILAPYPGSLHIPEEAFRIYVRAVLVGLANNGFRNIVIRNGHGPQGSYSSAVGERDFIAVPGQRVAHQLVDPGKRYHATVLRRRRRSRNERRNRNGAGGQSEVGARGAFYSHGHGHIAPESRGGLVGNSVSF